MIWGGGVAPGLVEVKRKVEKERVKDGLRAWLQRKAARVLAEEVDAHETSNDGDVRRSRISVRLLVPRFTTAAKTGPLDPSHGLERKFTTDEAPAPPPRPPPIDSKWLDRRIGVRKKSAVEPTRTHVNRLRRFWEGLAKGS